ncbi:MAG: hypothetical protein KAT04_00250 [Methylococcales bacterium]|nr:hypothetical protein [Methylococcales bacterium]
MKNKSALFAIAILLSLSPITLLAEISGKVIVFACSSCHGNKLKALNLSQNYINHELPQTLLAFKYNNKYATIMDRISKGYTDAELGYISDYLSGENQ